MPTRMPGSQPPKRPARPASAPGAPIASLAAGRALPVLSTEHGKPLVFATIVSSPIDCPGASRIKRRLIRSPLQDQPLRSSGLPGYCFQSRSVDAPCPSVKKKVAPSSLLSAQARPPWRSAMRSTMARPMPVPAKRPGS